MQKNIFLIILFTLISFGSYAQEVGDILNILVDKELITSEYADSLIRAGKQKKQPDAIRKLKSAFISEAFQLYGYAQVIYNLTENTDRGFIRTSTHNSIDIARAIIFANGKLGAKNQFGYQLMFDFGSNAMMHEIYGEWTPIPAINLRFGQYKIPFSMENPISPTNIETVYFTRSISAMSGSAGDFNQYNPAGAMTGVKVGRDAGFQLSGRLIPRRDYYLIEYYTGLFNGTGMNVKDNNNHKDFIATAYVQPVKGLKVGGSVYSGKLFGQHPSILGSPQMTPEAPANHVRNHWAAGFEYNAKNIYARSEFSHANDGGLLRDGAYGTVMWKIVPGKWEILGKYDYYEPNKDLTDNEITDITAGINFYFAPFNRLQLNYIYTDDKAAGTNNMLAAQLQLFF
ncbi:MAG: OprO/OprP family phosphate-selective porin [Tannerella sp.]|jgi:hypothetical protein|nr:OprO/OprP family phosphate-selective porin [Tannerella sp.]